MALFTNTPHKGEEYRCCSNPIIVEENGFMVCHNCGMVYDNVYSNHESRMFNHEDIMNKKSHEAIFQKRDTRTVLYGEFDQSGKVLDSKVRQKYRRLNRINSSLERSLERNILTAENVYRKYKALLDLPNDLHWDVFKIYKLAVKKGLAVGRSIPILMGACIALTMKIHNIVRTLDDIAEALMINRKKIEKAMRKILQQVLPELPQLKERAGSYSIVQYIQYMSYQLELDDKIRMKVLKIGVQIYNFIRSDRVIFSGKDPKGIAAACLYLALKKEQIPITQRKMASIGCITEITLRERTRDIKNIIKKANSMHRMGASSLSN